ncbi:MAG: hypothetical protein IJB52_07130 [Clostridia bacterium]|nr:hypothetical protein [Clostridia bacterium]
MKKTLSLIMAGLLTVAMAATAAAGSVPAEDIGEGYDGKGVAFGVKGIAADVEWAADGEWTEGEYAEIDVKNTWVSAAANDAANDDAAKNLDFKLGMSWDADYLYTYIEFEDANGHNNTWGADPASMWYSGAIQMNLAEVDAEGEDRLEYGVGLTSDSGDEIVNVWAAKSYDPTGDDFEVIVDGDTIIYEIRTPFAGFSSVKAAEGAEYGYCIVISWGNDQDYIHTQLGQGCTGFGKNAKGFADITLEEAIVVETEPETVEVVEDAAAAAPQTFDAGIVAAVAAIVSAAGYAISKKH